MLACVLSMLLAPDAPDGITLRDGKATLELRGGSVENKTLVVPYDGQLRMTVTVDGGDGLVVNDPSLEYNKKAWSLHRREPERTETPEPGRRRWSKSYLFEPLGPGEHPLPGLQLKYREKESEPWVPVTWSELSVRVADPQPVEDTGVRGKPGIEQIEPLPAKARWWPYALSGAAVLVVVVSVVVWRKARRPVVSVSPDRRALQELASLERETAPETAPADWFHLRLSGILRRYCEERYTLPASRRTTEEFLTSLPAEGALGVEQRHILRTLLESCDLAKFARLTPPAERRAEELEQAREFVRITSIPQATPPAEPMPVAQSESV